MLRHGKRRHCVLVYQAFEFDGLAQPFRRCDLVDRRVSILQIADDSGGTLMTSVGGQFCVAEYDVSGTPSQAMQKTLRGSSIFADVRTWHSQGTLQMSRQQR